MSRHQIVWDLPLNEGLFLIAASGLRNGLIPAGPGYEKQRTLDARLAELEQLQRELNSR
jgi:hypothetical protein